MEEERAEVIVTRRWVAKLELAAVLQQQGRKQSWLSELNGKRSRNWGHQVARGKATVSTAQKNLIAKKLGVDGDEIFRVARVHSTHMSDAARELRRLKKAALDEVVPENGVMEGWSG